MFLAGKYQTVQEGALSKQGENPNQESGHPSWDMPGMEGKDKMPVGFLRKCSMLIWLPPLCC